MLKNRQYDNTLRKIHTTPELSSFSASLTNNRFTFTKMLKSKHCLSMALKTTLPIPHTKKQKGICRFFKTETDFFISGDTILIAKKHLRWSFIMEFHFEMEMRTCRWLGHSSSISQTFCSTDWPLSSSSTSSSSSSTLANQAHSDFLRQTGPWKMLVRKLGPRKSGPQSHKYTNIILLVVSSQVLDRMVL